MAIRISAGKTSIVELELELELVLVWATGRICSVSAVRVPESAGNSWLLSRVVLLVCRNNALA